MVNTTMCQNSGVNHSPLTVHRYFIQH